MKVPLSAMTRTQSKIGTWVGTSLEMSQICHKEHSHHQMNREAGTMMYGGLSASYPQPRRVHLCQLSSTNARACDGQEKHRKEAQAGGGWSLVGTVAKWVGSPGQNLALLPDPNSGVVLGYSDLHH